LTTTEDNLKEAFAGESQANRKYLAFAAMAEREGYPNAARLFRAAAEAETIHALAHLKALNAIGTTAENLQSAIDGETYEYREMYPPMLKTAQEDNHRARAMFRLALGAEEVHANRYREALDSIKGNKDLPHQEIYLCPVCGNIEFGKPDVNCPICGALASKYVKVE